MGPNQEACRPKTLTLFAPHTDLGKDAGAGFEDAKNKFRWQDEEVYQSVCCALKIPQNSHGFLPAVREAAVGLRRSSASGAETGRRVAHTAAGGPQNRVAGGQGSALGEARAEAAELRDWAASEGFG